MGPNPNVLSIPVLCGRNELVDKYVSGSIGDLDVINMTAKEEDSISL